MGFYSELIRTLLANAGNDFSVRENYDEYRFGKVKKEPVTIKSRIREALKDFFAARGYTVVSKHSFNSLNLDAINGYFDDLNHLYEKLADTSSRELLLKLLAYKILGNTKVKLPLSHPAYWEGIRKVESLSDPNEFLDVDAKFMQWRLHLIDLKELGIPIKFYFTPLGVYTDFVLKQYEYRKGSKIIKVEKGDYVIDAGGCWGDTALYFANEVGPQGKVFTYEFIPSNIELMNKNLSLNSSLRERINIVKNPVWEKTGEAMYYIDAGPGSKVFMEEQQTYDGKVDSLAIDQLVENMRIEKIDFIKMDIEGAEPYALKGALDTIRKFKPKLAIAIYHSMDDFTKIPRFIDELGLGYKLYLDHFTIHGEETVLFAEIQ